MFTVRMYYVIKLNLIPFTQIFFIKLYKLIIRNKEAVKIKTPMANNPL